MSKIQVYPDFWTLTRTSAKDAVRLYFEPIRVFASWVSDYVESWGSRRQDSRAHSWGVEVSDMASVLARALEGLNEQRLWEKAMMERLAKQELQFQQLTEKVDQILEATKDARLEEKQTDFLKMVRSRMEELEAQTEGIRKETGTSRSRLEDAGKKALSLADELRAIRGGGVHGEALSKRPNLPAEIERLWKSELDRTELTFQEALQAISEPSGVQLPEGGEGKGRGSSLRPSFETLKERIRNDLEDFASASAADAAKEVQSEGGLALDPLEKELSARMDNLVEEFRGKLKSRLEQELAGLANQVRALTEEVLQGEMNDPAEESDRRREPALAAERLTELIRQMAERLGKGVEK